MDIDDFRTVLESSGVDVWTFIETAISVASMDYGSELKQRRDGIVERLYAATASFQSRCQNCDEDDGDNGNAVNLNRRQQNSNSIGNEAKTTTAAAAAAVTDDDGSEDLDPYCGLFEDQQKRILEIKEHLEDPQQVWFFFFFFLYLNLVCLFFAFIFNVLIVCVTDWGIVGWIASNSSWYGYYIPRA